MQRTSTGIQALLDVPLLRQIRRNHGLEHATIHILSRRMPTLRVVGRSDSGGFWLYGNASTPLVEESVNQALTRMKNGDHRLAIHPNCGTNLVSVAILGAAAALLALVGSERQRFGKLQRIPLLILALMMAGLLGQPLGAKIQQHVTTLGDPGDLEIVSIREGRRGQVTYHRIETRSS
ncbi:MAG: hypothetical protein JXJ17_11655 [Anaerolineae bacterium]|nr:hypothetical protein [Anaerolineae bacterium]